MMCEYYCMSGCDMLCVEPNTEVEEVRFCIKAAPDEVLNLPQNEVFLSKADARRLAEKLLEFADGR